MSRPTPWLFQDAPVLLAALDEQMVCRHASLGWRGRLGVRAKDELELPLYGLFALKDEDDLQQQLEALLQDGTSLHETPVSLAGKDGIITQGLLSAWCVDGEHGRWLLLTAVCDEELNQALDELRRLRTTHELILNAAGEGIYGLDCEGRTTFGNAASIEILGWKPDDIMEQKAHDVHHHSYPDGSPYPRDA